MRGPALQLELNGQILPNQFTVSWASSKGNVVQQPDGDCMVALPCIVLPKQAADAIANYHVIGWKCDPTSPPVHTLILAPKTSVPLLPSPNLGYNPNTSLQHAGSYQGWEGEGADPMATWGAGVDPAAAEEARRRQQQQAQNNGYHTPGGAEGWGGDPSLPLQPLHLDQAGSSMPLMLPNSAPAAPRTGGRRQQYAIVSAKRARVPVVHDPTNKKFRYRLNCMHDGCDKEAVGCTNGERMYCKLHARERGLTPKERMCLSEGCDKRAQKCMEDGQTKYCKKHMREMGLSPYVQVCQDPDCEKRAQSSLDGHYVYCYFHMRERGIQSKKNLCNEPGCEKEVQASACGQYMYCRMHMRQYGLAPRS